MALSRFGSLRIPSEASLLRWRDVDWGESRLLIHSPKTEHHTGKGSQAVPIFGELRPYLDEVVQQATDRFDRPVDPDTFILAGLHREAATRRDWKAVNLRTRFEKIIKRAGLATWPRSWHNPRLSRQTELTDVFPAHVVSAWLGNSERTAAQHYLQVLDSHFQKAARIPARGVPLKVVSLSRTEPPKLQNPRIAEGSHLEGTPSGPNFVLARMESYGFAQLRK